MEPTNPTKPAAQTLVMNPAVDVAEYLVHLMGDTGKLQEVLGGFRIKIDHVSGFPWGPVLKTLVYRDFKVSVTRHKAELFIEANL